VDSERRISVTVTHDALAYALNDTSARISDSQMYELLDASEEELRAALEDGRERFTSAFRLFADGVPVRFEVVEAPTVESVHQWISENPARRLPCKLDFVVKATLPVGATTLSLQFPAVLSDVILSIDRFGVEPVYLPLSPGERAPDIDVSMIGGASPTDNAKAGNAPDHGAIHSNPVGSLNVVWRFMSLGFTHIIPKGADHALFVFGLFLLSPRTRALLWQITAFTIAHSITLFLTTFHVIWIPSVIIEPTIAATIAFVAIENLFVTRVHAWRPAVAFVFGLVHGMGFASALREVGLPTGQVVAGVLAFNVGVEGGHLAVLSLAFLTLGWWRNKEWFRARIAVPLSMVIAGIAVFWIAQRLMATA
jgi:hypothetical protein